MLLLLYTHTHTHTHTHLSPKYFRNGKFQFMFQQLFLEVISTIIHVHVSVNQYLRERL